MTPDQLRETYEIVWTGSSHREWWPEPPEPPAPDLFIKSARGIPAPHADAIVLACLPAARTSMTVPLSTVMQRSGLTHSQTSDALTRLVKASRVRKVGCQPTRYRRTKR